MDRYLEQLTNRIRNSDDNNKGIMLKFENLCFAQGLSQARIKKYLFTLIKLSEFLGKNFAKADINDITNLVAKLEQSDYSENTKKDFKICLKKLYAWLRGCDKGEYPPEVKFITTTLKKNREQARELLTKEEVELMISSADSVRDKAILNTLWESGCRIGELINMKQKDIVFDDYSPIVTLQGKTGVRKVRIIDKQSYLKSWLDTMPDRNPDAPVWVTKYNRVINNGRYNKMKGCSVNKVLRDLAKKCNIRKRVYPHLFRSSRATYLASMMPEQLLKKQFGWTQDSTMLAVYISQNDLALDEAILKMNGLIENREEEAQTKMVIKAFEKLAEKDPKFIDKVIRRMNELNILEKRSGHR